MYKIIVFDLDQTLWWCDNIWIDRSGGVPFTRIAEDELLDSQGMILALFPHARAILNKLSATEAILVVASRSKTPDWAKEALELMDLTEYFADIHIYPGTKLVHFAEIREKFGVDYSDMLFFDDEKRNIAEISELGVECVFLQEGITCSDIDGAFGNRVR